MTRFDDVSGFVSGAEHSNDSGVGLGMRCDFFNFTLSLSLGLSLGAVGGGGDDCVGCVFFNLSLSSLCQYHPGISSNFLIHLSSKLFFRYSLLNPVIMWHIFCSSSLPECCFGNR